MKRTFEHEDGRILVGETGGGGGSSGNTMTGETHRLATTVEITEYHAIQVDVLKELVAATEARLKTAEEKQAAHLKTLPPLAVIEPPVAEPVTVPHEEV